MIDTPGTLEERARRIVARFYQGIRDHDYAHWVMEGRKDGTNDMRLVVTALAEAADEIASLRARVNSLFSAIQHGDEEHRAWLKEAIENHFAGVAVPPVRGSGTKEALRARVEAYREALVDLMSWFPKKPSDPEWRIKGGVFGADDAVEHARSLVEKEIDT